MDIDMSQEIQEREFKEFYNRFYPRLVQYACSICFNRAVSEDIVQEVFIYIWKNADKLDIGPSLKPYAYTAVKNGCIDYFRSLGVTNKLGFLDFYAEVARYYDPMAIVEEEEEKKGFFAAVLKIADTFPPQMKQIFRLWLCDNCKQTEIARKLDLHPNTVRTQLKRAQQKICEVFARRSREK